jgi:hypothetical protein
MLVHVGVPALPKDAYPDPLVAPLTEKVYAMLDVFRNGDAASIAAATVAHGSVKFPRAIENCSPPIFTASVSEMY